MDRFTKEKSDFLKKKDKSKKGYVDENIEELINAINSKKDYYTTSSCAGRIVLLEMKSKKKNECNWIFSAHHKVTFNIIQKILTSKFFENQVWFKQQPIILHIACRNLESAKIFLNSARKTFKHSGIISANDRKVVVEIIGNERIETVIADKNFAADKIFVKNLVRYANENFEENRRKSKELLKLMEKI